MTLQRAAGTLRDLRDRDQPAIWELLDADPVERVFIASRVSTLGVQRLGCPLLGWFEGEELVSLCHCGANLMPVAANSEALAAYAARLGSRRRRATSIVGESQQTLELFQMLTDRGHDSWQDPRDIRPAQPMLAINADPDIAGDPRVRRIGLDHLAAYFEASVAMYSEEVGVSPVSQNTQGYFLHVRTLIESGRAFGIVDRGRVIFKADLGATAGGVAQVQGVWLDPAVRGRGLAAPAMASVVRIARQQFPVISLYVNDFNLPARGAYARCGFDQVGEFATILY